MFNWWKRWTQGERWQREEEVHNPDPAVRRQALAWLAAHPDDRTVWRLQAALNDADPGVQEQAFRGLAGLDGWRESEMAESALRDHLSDAALAGAIEQHPDWYSNTLVDRLSRVEDDTRSKREHLYTGHATGSVYQTTTWKESREQTRRAAAHERLRRLLARTGPTATEAELRSGLTDQSREYQAEVCRVLAARTVEAIGDARTAEPLWEAIRAADHPVLRRLLVEALGRTPDPAAVPLLLTLVADPDEQVQAAAIAALGCQGDERAVGPLVALLPRREAAEALGDIGDARALGPLLHMVWSPVTRDAALAALGRLGDERAVDSLVDLFAAVSTLSRDEVYRAYGSGRDLKRLIQAPTGRRRSYDLPPDFEPRIPTLTFDQQMECYGLIHALEAIRAGGAVPVSQPGALEASRGGAPLGRVAGRPLGPPGVAGTAGRAAALAVLAAGPGRGRGSDRGGPPAVSRLRAGTLRPVQKWWRIPHSCGKV